MNLFRRSLIAGVRSCTLAMIFAFVAIGSPAAAQTIDDIIKRGKVLIAVDITNPPHGTMGADMQPDGYEVAIARAVAKNLGVEIEIVPVTSQNRISILLTNRVDILIAGLTVTSPRAFMGCRFINSYS